MSRHQLPVPTQEIVGSCWYLGLHRVAQRFEGAYDATPPRRRSRLTGDLGFEDPTGTGPYALVYEVLG
jgi:hypothetical protein